MSHDPSPYQTRKANLSRCSSAPSHISILQTPDRTPACWKFGSYGTACDIIINILALRCELIVADPTSFTYAPISGAICLKAST
jgi:hypothetical protein